MDSGECSRFRTSQTRSIDTAKLFSAMIEDIGRLLGGWIKQSQL